jgi:geranylgeranyl diphosphate synthase type I
MPHLKEGKNEEDILTIFRLKTAHYTIIGPLQLGAVLGGASNLLLTDIGKISETLGIAFQIQDDILGVFGDEKTLGKSVTSDIEEGKNTLLIVKALENANPEQKKILERYYGKGKIGEPELEQIKKVFVDTGALEYSQTRAKKMIEEAKRVIAKMEIESKYQDLLTQMADFLVERSK